MTINEINDNKKSLYKCALSGNNSRLKCMAFIYFFFVVADTGFQTKFL